MTLPTFMSCNNYFSSRNSWAVFFLAGQVRHHIDSIYAINRRNSPNNRKEKFRTKNLIGAFRHSSNGIRQNLCLWTKQISFNAAGHHKKCKAIHKSLCPIFKVWLENRHLHASCIFTGTSQNGSIHSWTILLLPWQCSGTSKKRRNHSSSTRRKILQEKTRFTVSQECGFILPEVSGHQSVKRQRDCLLRKTSSHLWTSFGDLFGCSSKGRKVFCGGNASLVKGKTLFKEWTQ